MHLTKSLVCYSSRCGGPGFIIAGTKTMPASSAQGYQMVMSNPSLTDRKLLTAMQLLSEGSPLLAGFNGRITGAHKGANSILITVAFNKYVPKAGQVYGVARVNVTASQMHVLAAGGPTTASAQERLRLVRD